MAPLHRFPWKIVETRKFAGGKMVIESPDSLVGFDTTPTEIVIDDFGKTWIATGGILRQLGVRVEQAKRYQDPRTKYLSVTLPSQTTLFVWINTETGELTEQHDCTDTSVLCRIPPDRRAEWKPLLIGAGVLPPDAL